MINKIRNILGIKDTQAEIVLSTENHIAAERFKAITEDIQANRNNESNAQELGIAIDSLDDKITAAPGERNAEAIINSCLYIKTILIEAKVQCLENMIQELLSVNTEVSNIID